MSAVNVERSTDDLDPLRRSRTSRIGSRNISANGESADQLGLDFGQAANVRRRSSAA